eukprot:79271_1
MTTKSGFAVSETSFDLPVPIETQQKIVDGYLRQNEPLLKDHVIPECISLLCLQFYGSSELFIAANNGDTEMVKKLLQNEANVNEAEEGGHTPLWIASLQGHNDVIRILLSHPVIDIDYKDLSGVNALWIACQNNNSEVVELLLHPRNVVIGEQTDNKADWWDVTQKKGANPNLA